MAQFTNQAKLSYNGIVLNSNVAVGEIREVLSAEKTATASGYSPGENITYIISIVNSGAVPYTGISVADNMGEYTLPSGAAVYPLTYVDGSVRYYVGGVLQPSPSVTVENTVTFGGIGIPAGGNAILVYEAVPNSFAPLAEASAITNTATVCGPGAITTVSVSSTLPSVTSPSLSISKQISPVPVTENSTLTYTFIIQNYGSTVAGESANIVLSDSFDPVLSNISVTLNGSVLAASDYSYDASSGEFMTNAGVITVPGATYTQNATTGEWSTTPGFTSLTVRGTV